MLDFGDIGPNGAVRSAGGAKKLGGELMSRMDQADPMKRYLGAFKSFEETFLIEYTAESSRFSPKVFPVATKVVFQKPSQGVGSDKLLKVYQLTAHFTDD